MSAAASRRAGSPPASHERIAFIHIPKTAGTSFIEALLPQFAPHEVCPAHFNPQLFEHSRAQLARYRLFVGHFYLQLLRQLLPSEPTFLTFLRDPIDRALSHYHQIQHPPDDLPDAVVRFGEKMTLEEFVFDYDFSIELSNLQTRYLSSRPAVDALERFEVEERHAIRDRTMSCCATDAMRVLDDIPFVGLTERFSDSLDLLAYTLAWKPLDELQLNRSGGGRPRADDLPAQILDRLVELNREDLRLHEYARRLFQERWRSMLRDLVFRAYVEERPRFACPASTLHFRFEHDEYLGNGWYRPEQAPAHGDFCWTGPGCLSDVRLPVCVGPAGATVHLGVVVAASADDLGRVALRTRGGAVPLTVEQVHKEQHVLIGHLPAEASSIFGTAFTIETARTLPAAEMSPRASDDRTLGVALNWIAVAPREANLPEHGLGPYPIEAYRAMLNLDGDTPLVLEAGEATQLWVTVRNTSEHPWGTGNGDASALRLRHRWRGQEDLGEGSRLWLGLDAGQELLVPLRVVPPRDRGSHVLEIDLVHEQVRSFGAGVAATVKVV